jgi:hypothetical protein
LNGLFLGFPDLFPDRKACKLLKRVRIVIECHVFYVAAVHTPPFNHVTSLDQIIYNLLNVLSSGARLQHIIVRWPGAALFTHMCDSLSGSLTAKIRDIISNDSIEGSSIKVEVICNLDQAAW